MRRSTLVPIVPALCSILASCGGEPTATESSAIVNIQAAATAGVVASATGSGITAPGVRTFAFQATKSSSGTVTGQANLTRPNGARFHVVINCLAVVGQEATMSGYITKSNVAGSGTPAWFSVVDNGEPPATDLITALYYFPPPLQPGEPFTCTDPHFELARVAILAGNVQVH